MQLVHLNNYQYFPNSSIHLKLKNKGESNWTVTNKKVSTGFMHAFPSDNSVAVQPEEKSIHL